MGRYRLTDLVDTVAFCDPGGDKRGGRLKYARANTAIVVVGQDILCRIFCLFCWAEQASTDRMTDMIFSTNEAFKPRVFGVEENGLQTLYEASLEREARASGIRIPLLGVSHSTRVKKEFRISSILQPVFTQGRIFTQEHQIELENEIRGFPSGKTLDRIDALASAVQLLPSRAPLVEQRNEVEAIASYLRDTGAPEWYIAQRVAEVQAEELWAGQN